MYPAKYWKRFVETPFANNKYILKKYLGSGGFGAVFLADEVIADRLIRQVAIKLVEVETQPDNDTEINIVDLDKKIKELQLSVQLQHPCLINCYTVEQDTLDDNLFLGLVMEIAQISLEAYQKDNSLSEEELKEIINSMFKFLITSRMLSLLSNAIAKSGYSADRAAAGQSPVHA